MDKFAVANARVKKIFILALVVTTTVSAEEEGADYQDFFLDDMPVVLSATRLEQSLFDAPAAITVIDKDMINASGAKEVVELMRLVPGMQVAYRRGFLPSVTYHGLSDEFSKGMQLLIDGQPFHLSSFGGIPWTDIPIVIEDIEKIEVIRGPNAATYGPNSFMAVINIITKSSAYDQGAQASYRVGSSDYHRGMVRYGGNYNDLNYRVSLLHQQDHGVPDLVDDQRTKIANIRLDTKLTPDDNIMFNFGYNEGVKQFGVAGSTSNPKRSTDRQSFSQLLRWEHQIDEDQSVATQFSFQQQRSDDDFNSDGQRLTNDQLSERIDFEIQHTLVPFQQARMIWGVGARRDRMRLPFWIADNDDKTNMQYRVFGNLEWHFLDQFTLNLGALFERNSYTDPDISPRAALNYHFTDHQTLRFVISRTSRIPVLGEEHLDIRNVIPSLIPILGKSTNDLEAETAVTYELGYIGRFLDDSLTVDMKFSRQRYRDLVNIPDFVIVGGAPVFRYDNDTSATMLSYELQLGYRPTRASLIHFGYSYVNISSSVDEVFEFRYQDSAPKHTINLLASHKFENDWQTSVGYYYRTKMQYLRVPDFVGPSQRLDLILQKTFKLTNRQKLRLALIHQNSLGTNHDFNNQNGVTDRTFFEVNYQFE